MATGKLFAKFMVLCGLMVCAAPVFAEKIKRTTGGYTALYVKSFQGAGELSATLSASGLLLKASEDLTGVSPFDKAGKGIVGSYSRRVSELTTSERPDIDVTFPENGDRIDFSWFQDGLRYSRFYLYENGSWRPSAEYVPLNFGVQNESQTVVTNVNGTVGALGAYVIRTVQLDRVIAALYLQSSTISGYTEIAGVGTTVLVVKVIPNGVPGWPFSGTVTSLVVFQ